MFECLKLFGNVLKYLRMFEMLKMLKMFKMFECLENVAGVSLKAFHEQLFTSLYALMSPNSSKLIW